MSPLGKEVGIWVVRLVSSTVENLEKLGGKGEIYTGEQEYAPVWGCA